MGLQLLKVEPLQGQRWITQGLALWRKRPISFIGLFTSFLMLVLLLMLLVPVAGGVMGLMLVPMLSLGAMVASRSALAGGQVHVGQLFAGFRHPDRARRRAQWQLCGAYALASLLVLWLSDLADGGRLEALMGPALEPDGATPAADPASGPAAPGLPAADDLTSGDLLWGLLVRLGLTGLLSVPFWHAPALVHWGGQGALQAVFSSTVAVWRARGAFMVYTLGWTAMVLVLAPVAVVLMRLLGSPQLASMLALPMALTLSSMFYTSLWFVFADSFGATARATDAAPQTDDDRTPPAV